MKALDFLRMLRERDIQVWADGERLRCNGPVGALTPELRQDLQEHKGEILRFLRAAETLLQQQHAIVPLQPRGTSTPVFAVAGHNGDVFCFRALARHLGPGRPFFGLQPPGLDGSREPLSRVEDLAACFATQIRAVRPDGPCVIAGYCAGGTIAFELAQQLMRDGMTVQALVLFGSPFPFSYRFLSRLRQRFSQEARRVARHAWALAGSPRGQRWAYISRRLRNFKAERAAERHAASEPVLVWRDRVGRATLAAIRRYTPCRFPGRLSLLWPNKQSGGDAMDQWSSIAADSIAYFGPDGCDGATMLRDPHAGIFAELFHRAVKEDPNRKITVPKPPLRAPPYWRAGRTEALSL